MSGLTVPEKPKIPPNKPCINIPCENCESDSGSWFRSDYFRGGKSGIGILPFEYYCSDCFKKINSDSPWIDTIIMGGLYIKFAHNTIGMIQANPKIDERG